MGRKTAHYDGGDPLRNLAAEIIRQALLEATGKCQLAGAIEPDPASAADWLHSDRCQTWIIELDIDPAAFYESLAALGIYPPPISESIQENDYDNS